MIFGLLKSVKFWLILAAITAMLGFIKWGHGEVYDAGYNAAELKWRTAQQAAIDEAVAEAREADRIAHEAAMANIERETEIVEVVRVVEREIPRIVERVVIEKPECRDLGPDIQRMFNDAIIASGGAEGLPAADSAAEPSG
jgi:predicted Zn-ribbon and HTH transcriptional regulator